MKPSFQVSCLLLILLLQSVSPFYYTGTIISLSFSLSYIGFQLRDLNVDASFASDATSWSTYGGTQISPMYTYCGSTLLMGGYCVLGCAGCSQIGNYFQRVYTNLPAHNYIRFSLNFWAIDSWDLNQNGHDDGFQLYFDGMVIDGWHMSLAYFPSQICGVTSNAWNELPNIMITGLIAHTGSSLTFRVVSDLNEESCNESFGFRDIQLLFDQNGPTGLGNAMCANAPVTLPNRNCACPQGQYRSGASCLPCNAYCSACFGPSASDCYGCIASSSVIWDGTQCTPCYSTCATCSGASANCLTCVAGYYWIPLVNKCVVRCPWPLIAVGTTCVSPCSVDQFVMWDGVTCASTCPAPFQSMNEADVGVMVLKLCMFPCSPVEFLYWDGTCGQDCGSPLVISNTGLDGRKLCTFPCTYDYQYAYWDGSCSSSCDPPRITHLQNGRRICRQPCLDGQYLYWTGECVNSCPVYHTTPTVGSILYCSYPCAVSQFLYWDGVCRNTCPFPLNTRVQYSRQYCDYPTSTGNSLYWDGSSASGCPSPFTGTSQYTAAPRLFCDYGCQWGYTYWDSSCLDECPYALTTTIVKNRQYCDSSCTGSNYLYWNGTCSSNCNPPLTSRQFLLKNFCDYPCLSSQYLYWDGACSFTCSGIFKIRQEGSPMVKNFCDFPCLPTYYYYWNSSCISVCPPPLIASTDRSRLYCNFPCLEGQFYYYNGTCSYTCDRDYKQLVMSSVEKYCVESPKYVVTCHEDDFYYWNNTCHETCPFPLVQSVVGTQKWCVYPCLVNQFLYENGTCLETCEPPFIERNELGYKYCNYSCEPSEYSYWNGTCLPSCPMPFRHELTWYGVNCLLPCETSTEYYDVNTEKCVSECASPSVNTGDLYPICLLAIAESPGSYLDLVLKAPETQNSLSLVTIPTILASIRYLSMPLPPRVENLVNSQGREVISLDFGSDMPQSLQTSFTKRSLPEIFEERGLHSDFIVNFWSKLMSWLLTLTALIIIIVFEKLCLVIGWGSARVYLETLKLIIKWNMFLESVATNAGEIIFYSLIELISLNSGFSISFSSVLLVFTVLSAVTVMAGAMFNLIKSCSALRRKMVLYKDSSAYSHFVEKWSEFEVLFSGFRGHSNLNQYFFLLYMFRIAFPMVIAVFLRSWPFAQTLVQAIFSFVVMTYILTAIPLARRINFLQLFLMEGLAFIVNFSLMLLCLLNMVDAKHSREYNLLGDIVVAGCSTINLLEIVFLIVKLFEGARAIDQYIMTHPEYPRTIWLQLLVFAGQQGGMGFEEMFVDPEAAKIFNNPKYLIGKRKKRPERAGYRQALRDHTRNGAFAVSQQINSGQGSTMASFFNRTPIEPVRAAPRIPQDLPVSTISNLVSKPKRQDPPEAEFDPFYWLYGIARVDEQGPGYGYGLKNASKPRAFEFSRPDQMRGRREKSPSPPPLQNLKSYGDDPFRKRSLSKSKNQKKQGGKPKIMQL